jgi:hypothetical protein
VRMVEGVRCKWSAGCYSLERSRASYQLGSLKFTHHFGLNLLATLGEHFILQDSGTQSINELLLLWFASVVGAAALAAGDKLRGAGRGMSCVDEGACMAASS